MNNNQQQQARHMNQQQQINNQHDNNNKDNKNNQEQLFGPKKVAQILNALKKGQGDHVLKTIIFRGQTSV